MPHLTASRAGILTWQRGMVTTIAFPVAVMLLAGCASSGLDKASSAQVAGGTVGTASGMGNEKDPSGTRVGDIHKGSADCQANVPTPTPNPPAHRVVQLVNCSDQTLLGAANAAKQPGQPKFGVPARKNLGNATCRQSQFRTCLDHRHPTAMGKYEMRSWCEDVRRGGASVLGADRLPI